MKVLIIFFLIIGIFTTNKSVSIASDKRVNVVAVGEAERPGAQLRPADVEVRDSPDMAGVLRRSGDCQERRQRPSDCCDGG